MFNYVIMGEWKYLLTVLDGMKPLRRLECRVGISWVLHYSPCSSLQVPTTFSTTGRQHLRALGLATRTVRFSNYFGSLAPRTALILSLNQLTLVAVTAMILGGVNVGATFFGLYMVERFGRCKCLEVGGIFQFLCFIVFASIGHFGFQVAQASGGMTQTKTYGTIMIVFA
jgi:hypothetical protein